MPTNFNAISPILGALREPYEPYYVINYQTYEQLRANYPIREQQEQAIANLQEQINQTAHDIFIQQALFGTAMIKISIPTKRKVKVRNLPDWF